MICPPHSDGRFQFSAYLCFFVDSLIQTRGCVSHGGTGKQSKRFRSRERTRRCAGDWKTSRNGFFLQLHWIMEMRKHEMVSNVWKIHWMKYYKSWKLDCSCSFEEMKKSTKFAWNLFRWHSLSSSAGEGWQPVGCDGSPKSSHWTVHKFYMTVQWTSNEFIRNSLRDFLRRSETNRKSIGSFWTR